MFTTSDRTRRVIRALATASLLALPLSGSITAAAAAEAPTALAPGDPGEPGAPTVRMEVPDPVPNEAWHDDTVEVQIIGQAGLSPVENITWATTGAQPGGASVVGDRVTVRIEAQGTTRLSATASDADGYISAEAHVVIKIDRTPPTIDVTAPQCSGSSPLRLADLHRLRLRRPGVGHRPHQYRPVRGGFLPGRSASGRCADA
jgi:hypothetical protein